MKFKEFLKSKGIEEDAFAKMEVGEQAKLHQEYLGELAKSVETKAEKTEIESIKETLKTVATAEELAKATKAIEDLQETINEFRDNQLTPKQHKNFSQALTEVLAEKKDDLAKMKDNASASVRLVIKTVGDMTLATNIVDDAQIPQAEIESGITRIVRRNPFILDLVNTGTINSNVWEWVQHVNPEGGAGNTAEGAKKSQADFDLELASVNVKKITCYIKVSKEMLDDVDAMRAEINQELTELINLRVDAQLLSGDGTGQNLVGILENAIPYNAGSFAGTVIEPNNADVLMTAINQVRVALFNPNNIVMHPSDVTALELSKGNDGHYVMPPFTSADGTVIKGIRVVTNVGVTEGDFLVGDFTKAGVRFKEGLTISVGYENEDFTKNFVTILAETRLAQRVKSNHYPAFVYGTFADAIEALAIAEPSV